jgi:hypothetical protein
VGISRKSPRLLVDGQSSQASGLLVNRPTKLVFRCVNYQSHFVQGADLNDRGAGGINLSSVERTVDRYTRLKVVL